MTKKEIIELYLADLNNLVANSDAKRSRIIDLENELKILNQNKMKQTAVEWLIKELRKNRIVIPMAMEQQAKVMEKEQIINAYMHGQYNPYWKNSEQYYNETFKSE